MSKIGATSANSTMLCPRLRLTLGVTAATSETLERRGYADCCDGGRSEAVAEM